MQITLDNDSGSLVVKLGGEVDHHISSDIRETIDRNLEKSKYKNLIFDFSDVSFMDSSGIGVLIGRYKRVRELGGKMTVLNARGHVNKILEMSGINQLLGTD